MTFNGPIGGLIDFAIGGGWGSEVPKENHSRVAVIRGTDIPKVAAGDFSTVPFRYESDKKVLNRILAPGDIVLETAGGSSANGQYTGRTLLITQEILDVLGPTICASFCKKLVLNKALVIPPYFYFYMQDLYKSGRVASYDSQSTGISNFQYEAFINNEVLQLPKLELQKSVAAALSNLQCKINTNSQISKTLEDIAQIIFKSWFIDFDPVKAKMAGEKPAGMDAATAALFPDSMVESGHGLIPKSWEVVTLEHLAQISKKSVNPQSNASTEFSHYSIPAFDSGLYPTYVAGEKILSGKFIVDRPSILVSKLNPQTQRIWTVTKPHNNAICSTEFIVLTTFLEESFSFINQVVKSVSFQEAFVGMATGSTGSRQRVRPDEILQVPIVVPNMQVVRAFSDVTFQMIQEIDLIREQNQALINLRDALLPRLISGELQIPEEMLAS
jgi:type I restriction enzyme S subunit